LDAVHRLGSCPASDDFPALLTAFTSKLRKARSLWLQFEDRTPVSILVYSMRVNRKKYICASARDRP
jgi:hypothetical protein